jgi:hypothetical protein
MKAEPMTGASIQRVDMTLCAHCKGRISRNTSSPFSGWYHLGEEGRHGTPQCPAPGEQR